LLSERITARSLLAAALGFAGILIVARPDFGRIDPGVAAAAASAVCFALTGILTKRLTRAETVVSILFWLTLMQFGMGLVTAFWDGEVAWPTARTLPWLVLVGFAGVLAHLCLTSALRLAPASVVMPIDFARLPLIALVGALFYAEPVEAEVMAGAVLILIGNWINLRGQRPQGAAPPQV
jgi:drug/metabolite transporter (DMT)-like permease